MFSMYDPKLCAFNISWHDKPKKNINSYIDPKGYLLRGSCREWFRDAGCGFSRTETPVRSRFAVARRQRSQRTAYRSN